MNDVRSPAQKDKQGQLGPITRSIKEMKKKKNSNNDDDVVVDFIPPSIQPHSTNHN
jgi:hypothetical protein